MQYITNAENNIRRDRAISCFDRAHVGPAHLDPFGKLPLGIPAQLAVVRDPETQKLIPFPMTMSHGLAPIVSIPIEAHNCDNTACFKRNLTSCKRRSTLYIDVYYAQYP